MPSWLANVLRRVHELAATGRLRLTLKADRELAALGLDPEDVRDVLVRLTARDSGGRLISERTAEWMYIFRPSVGEVIIYLKLVLRSDCVIVSFHEDEEGGYEEEW